VLRKPCAPEQLAEALKLVLDKSWSSAESAAAKTKPNSHRALIVDDSAAARLHIRGVLEGLGLTKLMEAADGAEAVAVVAKEKFDLIVSDYNMPYMDGRGLVGYLKHNPATASVPIIIVTTENDPGKLEALRQLGVAAICDKTFRPDEVRKIVDHLLRTP
jgi:two-component system chemotaxis response regulator CheY